MKILFFSILISLSFSNFRLGIDLVKDAALDHGIYKTSGNIKSNLVFGYDILSKKYPLGAGIEYVVSSQLSEKPRITGLNYILSAELKEQTIDIDLLSIYVLSKINVSNNLLFFLKLGYSFFPGYDDNGYEELLEYQILDELDSEVGITAFADGGIMYGIGANYKNIQFTLSKHTGEFNVTTSEFIEDDPIDRLDVQFFDGDIDILRINISYRFFSKPL